jgi:hypothetical protein
VQINDLSFRRHILVQVLIIMEFILSQSARAKAKITKAFPVTNKGVIPNKGVTYEWSLSEEDVSNLIILSIATSTNIFTDKMGPRYKSICGRILEARIRRSVLSSHDRNRSVKR